MNKWAANTIRENTNIPVIEKDINEVSAEEILEVAGLKKEEVFMVAGGPPCQPFSLSGKQKGLSDFRANTIVRYLSLVEEIHPKFFIMENVRGLLSAKLQVVPEEFSEYEEIKDEEGSVLYFLKNEFEKYGYTISFALFNSANYGVPQKRERMIIFGHRGKERIPLPRPTHSENGSVLGTLPWKTLGEALEGLEPLREGECGKLQKKQMKYLPYLKEGENWKNLPDDVIEEAMGASYKLGGGKTGFYRRLSFSQPSPTLLTSPIMQATLLAHPTELRPLSIREYARIQEFPDDWILKGNLAEMYKQVGNAVPVGMGYMAAKHVISFYEEKENIIKYSRYKNTTDYEFKLNISRDKQVKKKEMKLFMENKEESKVVISSIDTFKKYLEDKGFKEKTIKTHLKNIEELSDIIENENPLEDVLNVKVNKSKLKSLKATINHYKKYKKNTLI